MSISLPPKIARMMAFFFPAMDQVRDIELRGKLGMMNCVAFVGVAVLVPFGLYALVAGEVTLGIVDLAAAALLIVLYLVWLRRADFGAACRLGIALFFVLFTYLTWTGGLNASGFLWSYLYPMYVIFLLGARKGFMISFLFWVMVMVFFFLDIPLSSRLYPFDIKVRFAGSYLTIMMLSMFLENTLRRLKEALQGQNRALELAVDDLQEKDRELVLSEQRFRDMTFNSFETIWEIDSQWRYTYVNGRVEEVLGYTATALLGSTPWDYMAADDRLTMKTIFDKTREKDGRITDLERTCRHRNGSTVYLLTNAVAIHDKQGSFIGLRGVDKNITERIAERKHSEELEDQLRQSQKLEAIAQLAGGIAHDFNNKLGAIIGFAEMLRSRYPDPTMPVAGYSDRIIQAAQKSADLTAKLLAFARQGKFQVVAVNLHEAIEDVVRLITFHCGDMVTIVTELSAAHPVVMGDMALLQNAVTNLALNARDAMPDGGTITIATDLVSLKPGDRHSRELDLEAGEYCIVAVSDTGVGIDDSVRKKLFEPFFTTKKFGERTGMGLASVYGTVKSHHGAIEVSSVVGSGTTFTLYLPLAREQRTSGDEPAGVHSGLQGVTIMLVDDDEFIREIVSEMLSYLGCSVVSCVDGLDAVETYRRRHAEINLVILDVVMPRLGGYGCFCELKKINPQVKAIVSSGYSIDGEASQILAEGARSFIQKPFNLEALETILRQELSLQANHEC